MAIRRCSVSEAVNPEFSLLQAALLVLLYGVPLLAGLILHEVAHARVAAWCGDDSARRAGRFTLNPLPHLDLFGSVLLPLLFWFGSGGRFVFGFLKPVPINPMYMRQPRRDLALTAAAGPFSNLLQALLWQALELLLQGQGFIGAMAQIGVEINLLLCVVNLLPLPPLDGAQIVRGLAPLSWLQPWQALSRYAWIPLPALLLLQAAGIFDLFGVILLPMIEAVRQLLLLILLPFN
ncbi:site-2 protease family protein [Massilia sp. W12]|uniref:site-2 protease family protein n=1 Tax=Massilia sp. W12 TaxID=3126507 RepID=UPI0030D541DD